MRKLVSAVVAVGAVVAASVLSVPGVAAAAGTASAPSVPSSWRTLHYGGETLRVPPSWAVDQLAAHPDTCVRYDRHAVYLGTPGRTQACPAEVVGVTEAVSLQPLATASSPADALATGWVGAQAAQFDVAAQVAHRFVVAFPGTGVLATISWGDDPTVARTILGSFRSTPSGTTAASPVRPAAVTRAATVERPTVATRTTSAAQTTGPVSVGPVGYSGEGFDTCETPSTSTMAAWLGASPYDAIGVYVGGANAGCISSNLTSSWVSTEVAAGWHILPIYVGLQASCADQSGLAPIQASSAAAEGASAADQAASEIQALGMGAGSPVFDDMEAWNTSNSSCSSAVVTYLKSWSSTLESLGYTAGVYGSADAGVAQDLAPLYGQAGGPQEIWFAQWDGVASTSSSYFPASDWPNGARVKQYVGGSSETWGGVSMNIDRDDMSATVVGNQQPVVSAVAPAAATVGRTVRVYGAAFVPGHTTVDFGSVPGSKVDVVSASQLTVTVPAQTPATVSVTVTTRGGTSAAAATFAYVPIVATDVRSTNGGYWLVSSLGNVFNFAAPFQGSAATTALPSTVAASAVDPATGGYWLATATGNVYHYQAPFLGSLRGQYLGSPVVGMAADAATGGYWLVTANGRVFGFDAPFEGSLRGRYLGSAVVGITADPSTGGYWLVTASGRVFGFGAPFEGSLRGLGVTSPVVGITADPSTGGYWIVTASGRVFGFDAPFLGSLAHRSVPAPVVGLSATATGYLLTTSAGNVYNFATRWYGSLPTG